MRKFAAYNIYIIYSIVTALLFEMVFTVSMLYQVQAVGLDAFQLVLVGTVLETACFLFEIPTGVIADVYSRKYSVILGLFLIGGAFILEGSFPVFWVLLLAQVLWGIGYTCISGALDAWITDETLELALDNIYLKGAKASLIGSILGVIMGTILGNISLMLPLVTGGILFLLLAVFLIIFMPERHFQPALWEERNTFAKMKHTLVSGLRYIKSREVILLLFLITIFFGVSSEGYDRLSTSHFLKYTAFPDFFHFSTVTWFGIFNLIGLLAGAVVIQFIIKKLEQNKRVSDLALLIKCSMGLILSLLLFTVAGNFTVMAVTYLSVNMFRLLYEPLFRGWINKNIDGNIRATVLSANGQINSLGQILGGPFIGVLANRISIQFGIFCAALFLLPVLALYCYSWKRQKAVNK